MGDRKADRFRLHPRAQPDGDAGDVRSAVQVPQVLQQIVAHGAGHAAVSQFEHGVGGQLYSSLHEGGSAMHDVPVEPVFHQRRARTGEQHAGDVLAIALAGHDDDWGAHPLLLYTEMIFIYYALTLQS